MGARRARDGDRRRRRAAGAHVESHRRTALRSVHESDQHPDHGARREARPAPVRGSEVLRSSGTGAAGNHWPSGVARSAPGHRSEYPDADLAECGARRAGSMAIGVACRRRVSELPWRDAFRRAQLRAALSPHAGATSAGLRPLCGCEQRDRQGSAAVWSGAVAHRALQDARRQVLRRESIARDQEGVRQLGAVTDRNRRLLRRMSSCLPERSTARSRSVC